ncbi:MAG: hypothetical protein HXY39_06035 [Chloroflexi bacterium]|nr:hypothetical protein [Chloroflexota bacterium]
MSARDPDVAHGRSAYAPAINRLIAAIQRRWGTHAIRRGVAGHTERALLPTHIAALDTLLEGGLPRGAITELLGAPTSGMTTIALTALAQTQAHGEPGACIDLSGVFDALYAAACGVVLHDLLLARPTGAADALELVEALVASGGLGMLVIDSLAWLPVAPGGRPLLTTALRRLAPVLARAPTALVALTFLPYPTAVAENLAGPGSPLAHAATLRLHVARSAWHIAPGDDVACRARITVLKRRGAADGAHIELPITFPRDGDAL